MSKISQFESVKKTTPVATVDIKDFLSMVQYGKWEKEVSRIREIEDKEKRDELKKNLPLFTISGVFDKRGQDHLISHSGFLCLDIDGADEGDRNYIEEDPHTYACFASASGRGLAMIVKIDPAYHKESFFWMQKRLAERYGITVDPAPKNVASLRAASYDPNLYVNEKARTSRSKKKEDKKKPKSLPIVAERSEVAEAVKEVVQKGVNIAPDYETYRDLGFAIANGFGEEGREWFHALCSNSEKYKETQADKQFDHCLARANYGGITVGTFYWMLREYGGVEVKTQSDRAVKVAGVAKMNERGKDSAKKQLTDMEGLEPSDAEKIVEEVYSRDDLSRNMFAKDPENLIESCLEWVRQNHYIRKNTVTRRLEEVTDEGIVDVDQEKINTIYLRARSAFNSSKVSSDLIEKVLMSEFIEKYDPIQEYIDQNREREPSGNIDELISCIDTPTPYAREFIRKWLIGVAAAAHWDPPRTVLVLVGPGSTGKTSFFRDLLPEKLRSLYAESSLTRGADDEILMAEKLLINDDEMAGKSKRDYRKFKEMASKRVFNLRVPYGKHNANFKRLAALSATANESEVISDPTGNTRILPIYVRGFDLEKMNAIDRDELFMELVRAYEDGEEHRLSREELNKLDQTSTEFEEIQMEEEAISMFFKAPEGGESYMEKTATEIKDEIEGRSYQRIQNEKKLGVALRKILGNPRVVSRGGVKRRVYKIVEIQSTTQTPPQGQGWNDLPGNEPEQHEVPF